MFAVCDKHQSSTNHLIFRFWDTNLQVDPAADSNKEKTSKSELSITLHETPKVKMEAPIIEPQEIQESMASLSAQKPPPASDYVEKLKDSTDGQIVSWMK